MARNMNRYQYETSPRKLEPDYAPKKRVAPAKKKISQTKVTKKKKSIKKQKKVENNMVKYLAIGFTILFAIAYRNSKIDENFKEMQKLKDELSAVEKENVQLEISIENASNLNNLEQQAKEQLGMQKLTNRQTVYINLPKEDYIETPSEEVKIENEHSFIKTLKKLFK